MAANTRCFTTGSRFVISGRLLAFRLRNEAESGSLALRLARSPHKFPPDGLLHLTLALATCRTGNLHGELLSVHKIKPGLSWRTGDAENSKKNSSALSASSALSQPPRKTRPSHLPVHLLTLAWPSSASLRLRGQFLS